MISTYEIWSYNLLQIVNLLSTPNRDLIPSSPVYTKLNHTTRAQVPFLLSGIFASLGYRPYKDTSPISSETEQNATVFRVRCRLSAGFTPFCCKLLGEPLISLMSQFPDRQNYNNTNLINLQRKVNLSIPYKNPGIQQAHSKWQ